MSEYMTLNPEPQVMGSLKKPYDDEFHNILKASTKLSLRCIPGDAKALVTDRAVYIVAVDQIPLKLLSYFTAHANRMWNGRGLLTFWAEIAPTAQIGLYTLILAKERERISELAKASYEMYLEEHRLDLEESLFPEYGVLPFDKTPEYYQRGIIVSK